MRHFSRRVSSIHTPPSLFTDNYKCAAQYHQMHICQYLLNQGTWPDQTAVLGYALSRYIISDREGLKSEPYRLFIQAPGFDVQIDSLGEEPSQEWLNGVKNTRSLDIILQNIPSGVISGFIENRFEVAMQLGISSTTSGFLTCLGVQASDPRLPYLRTKRLGRSVLHYVAHNLWTATVREDPDQSINDWVSLGVSVLRNGADPLSIAREKTASWLAYQAARINKTEWYLTPLLDCVNASNWEIRGSATTLRQALKALRTWTSMVQQAGIDLCQYGAKEREVWKSLSKAKWGSLWGLYTVVDLVYGSIPEQWSLKVIRVRNTEDRRLFELTRLPGCFPKEHDIIPTTIIWTPTLEEQAEGLWVGRKPLAIPSQPVDLQTLISHLEYREPVIELVNAVQDDNGVISVMQYRASKKKNRRSRSLSQPPPIGQRAGTRFDANSDPYSVPKWCPRCHNCAFDFKWGFRCCQADKEYPHHTILPRRCVQGVADGITSVQESMKWEIHSYLAEIAECQDNEYRRTRKGIRHTGTADCPWNCRGVDLARLKVPKPLLPYHPARRSLLYDKYRAIYDTPGS